MIIIALGALQRFFLLRDLQINANKSKLIQKKKRGRDSNPTPIFPTIKNRPHESLPKLSYPSATFPLLYTFPKSDFPYSHTSATEPHLCNKNSGKFLLLKSTAEFEECRILNSVLTVKSKFSASKSLPFQLCELHNQVLLKEVERRRAIGGVEQFKIEAWFAWLPGAQSIDELPRRVHVGIPFTLSDVIVVSLVVRFIMGFLGGMWFLIYKFRRRHLSEYEDVESFLQNDNHLSPIRYSYSDIKKMTRNFREKLGEGGFGSVYKGKLRSGHYVAVKLLGKVNINDKDFINEIGTIGRIHHVNVVQLVGYCAERSKRVLILDFMPKGSLDKYILNPEKASSLDWGMKFKIAVGVARGIQYLHCGCDIKILHFDIKPHNILLDDKFVPKVSDFGLAKLCLVGKDTVTMTAARGTIGYVAPELINRSIGLVSHKADVYSFGMLLMDMAGVNRELRGNKDDSTKYFPDWIYDCINKGVGIGIVEEEDNNVDDENGIGKSVLEKMTIVGLWCIQMNPDNRPSMNKVLEMLEGDVEDLKIPEHPSHLVNEDKSRAADSAGSESQLDYDNGSVIEISIA
ncbi:rust resistance kinase Lr10-like [Salvia splendens]|uniref:rust resistance kinase Lr10-like n=1 Tax=Salvia splendens TaxID=180675 RepID=UPI001C2536F0|nr:rust resistance kinase Lr10-like [Salvia splendens]